MRMRVRPAIVGTVATVFVGAVMAASFLQAPVVRVVEEKVLREYAGVYEWGPNAFVYLQIWNELMARTN